VHRCQRKEDHVEDNQGLCHQCGVLVNRELWEAHAGKSKLAASDEALKKLLTVLRSPLMMMSLPDRQEALELAYQYDFSAADLLNFAIGKARNT